MKNTLERSYKIVRTLPDGQRVLIGTFADLGAARKQVAAFSEYWPGDYTIEQPPVEQQAA